MKKVILSTVVLILMVFASCKNEIKKDNEEIKTEEIKEMADNTLHQCPMDCEKGKSYTEPGKCPVCKMDLKAKKIDMDGDKNHNEHEGMGGTNHDGENHEKNKSNEHN